jgi:hypothetical protein
VVRKQPFGVKFEKNWFARQKIGFTVQAECRGLLFEAATSRCFANRVSVYRAR